MSAAVSLRTLQTRFDRQAIEQLRAEIARLADENEKLRDENQRLNHAYMCEMSHAHENWEWAMDMQLQLCELTNSAPGITQSGQLVIIPSQPETGDGDAYLCLAQ